MELPHEKTFLGDTNQVPHKPGCTFTEDGKRLEHLDLGRSMKARTIYVAKTKVLISYAVTTNMSRKFSQGGGRVQLQTISSKPITSSPKGNDAHLRAIIQSEKKWKHQFFRRLRAASSVVHGLIWPNFKLIQALMYVIITC